MTHVMQRLSVGVSMRAVLQVQYTKLLTAHHTVMSQP